MNNNAPFFSIIVSTYNRYNHLITLLKKLEQIEYANWEVIIIDDGSTDETATLFDTNTNSNIRYFYQENAERGAARNHGVSKANGDFITYLDSDDYLLPDVFKIASKIIQENPNHLVFHLGYEIRNENDKLIQPAEKLPQILNNTLIEKNVMACIGVFISRKIVEEFKFNEDRILSGTEDFELWIRIASTYSIFHYNFTVAVLIDHDSRSMQLQKTKAMIDRIEMFISLSLNNFNVKKYLAGNINKFIAYRYSYISLHASLSKEFVVARRYLFRSIVKYPFIIFSKRVIIILKKMIFK